MDREAFLPDPCGAPVQGGGDAGGVVKDEGDRVQRSAVKMTTGEYDSALCRGTAAKSLEENHEPRLNRNRCENALGSMLARAANA